MRLIGQTILQIDLSINWYILFISSLIPRNSNSVCLGWSWESCICNKLPGHSEEKWPLVSAIGERYVQLGLGYHDDLAESQDPLCKMGPWYLLYQLPKITIKISGDDLLKGHTKNLRSYVLLSFQILAFFFATQKSSTVSLETSKPSQRKCIPTDSDTTDK